MSDPVAPRASTWLVGVGTIGCLVVLVVGLGFAVRLGSGTSATPGTAMSAPAPTGALGARPTPTGPTTTSRAAAGPGGDLSVAAQVGDCITLSGTDDVAQVDPAPCGSTTSNYKVVGRVPNQDQCVSDADATYYETTASGSGEAGALCLDVDWVPGDCYDISGSEPARVPCASSGPGDVQVQQILRGTVDEARCVQQAHAYPARKVEVCLVEPVTS